MEDNNKKVIQTKKVIVVKKEQQPTVVQTTQTTKDESVSHTLDEHLKTNIQTTVKRSLSWRDVITVLLVILILIGSVVVVYFFLDKNGMNPFVKKTTTETTKSAIERISTTQKSIVSVERETTTGTSVKPVNKVPSGGPGTYNNSTSEYKTTEKIIHVSPTSSNRSVSITTPDGNTLSFDSIKNNSSMTKKYSTKTTGDYKYNDTGKTLCTSGISDATATITCYNTSGNVSCTCNVDAK